MPSMHKIVPGVTALMSALTSVGLKGPFTVHLSAEDGAAMAEAIRRQTNGPAPEKFGTVNIANVTFMWPAAK